MKKILFITLATLTLVIMSSCAKEGQKDAKEGQMVSITLGFTLSADNGQNMSGTKSSNSEIFDEFYQKILSGELAAPTYHLTFTEKNTGAVYTVDGTWAGRDTINIRTGTYTVTGTSTATGENVQDKCSLKFNDEVFIDTGTKTITLKADYDCSLIIFSDPSVKRVLNFNGIDSTDLFKFSSYIYTFVHTKLWAEGKQSSAYLEDIHSDNTRFRIYTGNLVFKIGKYYVFGDVRTLKFTLDKMEEGGEEGYYSDLSQNGTANCYVVPSVGAYRFKATVKGGSTEPIAGTPVKAEVLWESFGTNVQPEVGDLINTANFYNGYVYFTTPTILANGNAVIAVKDASGNILWSWHIWVCKGFDPVATAQVYNNNAGTMMDRNLGATSATPGDVHALGLLYQWGRKDPFLSGETISTNTEAKSTGTWPPAIFSTSSIGTFDYVEKHPMQFINNDMENGDWFYTGTKYTNNTRWQTSDKPKGLYDPCPVGWRVPDGGEEGVWCTAFDTTSGWTTASNWDGAHKGMDFGKTDRKLVGTGSDRCWYPASGSINCNVGVLASVGDGGGAYSCSTDSIYAYFITFNLWGDISMGCDYRATAKAVRCAMESSVPSSGSAENYGKKEYN